MKRRNNHEGIIEKELKLLRKCKKKKERITLKEQNFEKKNEETFEAITKGNYSTEVKQLLESNK